MALPIYPGRDKLPGLTYGQKWSPAFFNQTATTGIGAQIGVGLSPYPLHSFELEYELLRDGLRADWQNGQGLEFKTLMGFFLQATGTLGRFLYKNLADHRVSQNVIATGDGLTTAFTLTRNFGANGFVATEPVGQVIWPGSDLGGDGFNAYLNGSAVPVNPDLYTVNTANPCANTITFATAPPPDQKIAVDMSYYYYCRFSKDTNDFEIFMDKLWNSEVTLVSCRAGA
jgi:hypothetical protein